MGMEVWTILIILWECVSLFLLNLLAMISWVGWREPSIAFASLFALLRARKPNGRLVAMFLNLYKWSIVCFFQLPRLLISLDCTNAKEINGLPLSNMVVLECDRLAFCAWDFLQRFLPEILITYRNLENTWSANLYGGHSHLLDLYCESVRDLELCGVSEKCLKTSQDVVRILPWSQNIFQHCALLMHLFVIMGTRKVFVAPKF